MNILTNILIFIAIVGMGMTASYKWGAAKAKGNIQKKNNKANEDANKTRHKTRTDSNYRARIRKLFDKR